jgi:hypothetical protein
MIGLQTVFSKIYDWLNCLQWYIEKINYVHDGDV